jgi:hypothetical protein
LKQSNHYINEIDDVKKEKGTGAQLYVLYVVRDGVED